MFVLTALGCGFLWAITLLTYLLPPRAIWGGLVTGTLTANQVRFIGIATLVFSAEATLARHLFAALAARWASSNRSPGWPTPRRW